jgi:hypothetical protein
MTESLVKENFLNLNKLYTFMKGSCKNKTHSGEAIYYCINDNCDARYLCTECVIENPNHFISHIKNFVPLDNTTKFLKFLKFTELEKLENFLKENMREQDEDRNGVLYLQQSKIFDVEKIRPQLEENFQNFYKNFLSEIECIINKHSETKMQSYLTIYMDKLKDYSNILNEERENNNKVISEFIKKVNIHIEEFINKKDNLNFQKFFANLNEKLNPDGEKSLENLVEKLISNISSTNKSTSIIISDITFPHEELRNNVMKILDKYICDSIPEINQCSTIFDRNICNIKSKSNMESEFENVKIINEELTSRSRTIETSENLNDKEKDREDLKNKNSKIFTFASENNSYDAGVGVTFREEEFPQKKREEPVLKDHETNIFNEKYQEESSKLAEDKLNFDLKEKSLEIKNKEDLPQQDTNKQYNKSENEFPVVLNILKTSSNLSLNFLPEDKIQEIPTPQNLYKRDKKNSDKDKRRPSNTELEIVGSSCNSINTSNIGLNPHSQLLQQVSNSNSGTHTETTPLLILNPDPSIRSANIKSRLDDLKNKLAQIKN